MEEEKEIIPITGDGFLPPEADYKETDWLAGSELSGIVYQEVLQDGNWRKYKPRNEDQNHGGQDKMCCVSSSFTNTVEEQVNKMIKDDLLDLDLLEPWLENGLLNTSERALAKGSGTTASGNSQPRVAEYARKNGLAPEKLWPTPPSSQYMSWSEYYKTIPNNVLEAGKKFLEYFDIYYERLPDSSPATLRKHIKQAPIWWATFTCSGWGYSDIVPACSTSPNHATIGDCYEDLKWLGDLDHYDPYEKKLAWNYKIYYPYKVLVIPKPLILKKKEEEGENMKLYKSQNQGSKVFMIGKGDSLFHHIDVADDEQAKALLGDDYDSLIENMAQIPDTQVGFALTTKKKVWTRLMDFFNSFKGR